MSTTKKMLVDKLRIRPETRAFIPANLNLDRVIFNRGGHGECFRWSILYTDIASDSCMSDILRCRESLTVTLDDGNYIYIEVPNSEMRRLYPERAAKGIYSDEW